MLAALANPLVRMAGALAVAVAALGGAYKKGQWDERARHKAATALLQERVDATEAIIEEITQGLIDFENQQPTDQEIRDALTGAAGFHQPVHPDLLRTYRSR